MPATAKMLLVTVENPTFIKLNILNADKKFCTITYSSSRGDIHLMSYNLPFAISGCQLEMPFKVNFSKKG